MKWDQMKNCSTLVFSKTIDFFHGREKVMLMESINCVMSLNKQKWLSIPGVLDVIVGRCKPGDCIIVYVNHLDRAMNKLIPFSVQGYKVKLKQPKELQPLV
jgi:hypothetical protein